MTEAELLALTRRMGIDWTASLADLARRNGIRRWFDFMDVVDVPLGALTSSIGGQFYVPHRPQDEPWPPTSYVTEIIAARDALRQHRTLTSELEQLLGPGAVNPATNVVGTTWRLGPLRVDILTFRRGTTSTNPLYERHPELWEATRISISTDHFAFSPDEALAPLLELSPLLLVHHAASRWFEPLIRQNPSGPQRHAPEHVAAVRFERRSGEIVVSAGRFSLVFRRDWCSGLSLTRLAPARGRGRSELQVTYLHPGAHGVARRLSLFSGAERNSLDADAAALSRALDLPLEIQDGDDD